MTDQVILQQLATRARRHYVEGASLVADYERAATSIHDREQVAEAGRLFAAGHDLLREIAESHGQVVDLRELESDAAERLDN